MRAIGPEIFLRPYLVVSVLLFTVVLLGALSGRWYGDFWEHAAVARELSARPFAPRHPQLLLDSPHPYYSPYALLVATGARLLHTTPITALAIAGIANLLLLLIGVRAFAAALGRDHAHRLAFYALMLMLFWWGPNAWAWSGFFHIGVIGFVLPYPSACAVAITLLCLALYRCRGPRMSVWHYLMLVLGTAFVLLSHPYTFIFLAAGFVGLALGEPANRGRELLRVTAVLAGGALIALPWPHFPLFDLLFNETPRFHQAHRSMFSLVRGWPVLALMASLIFARLPRTMLGPVITLALLTGVYLFGALTGHGAFGRVISAVALVVFFLSAERLVALEAWVRRRWSGRAMVLVPLGVVLISAALSWRPALATLANAAPPRVSNYRHYQTVAAAVDDHAVVMAELADGWPLPAFSGRVIATLHSLPFVSDHEARRLDISRFFDPATSPALRRRLIQKYHVKFVLVRNSASARLPPVPAMHVIEDPVATNGTFSLYRVRALADADVDLRRR